MKKMPLVWLLMICIQLGILQPALGGEVRPGFKIEIDGKVQAYTARTVTVQVKGAEIPVGDMPAIILEGRTMVPLKEVFESEGFGAQVEWNHERQEVLVTYNGNTIKIAINNPVAFVNGEPKLLDPDNPNVVPKLIRDTSKQYAKTMIPLRFVSEQLGYKVDWNAQSYTVGITESTTPEPTPTPIPAPTPPTPTPPPAPVVPVTPSLPPNNIPVVITENDSNATLIMSGANKPLPTPLSLNPILWNSLITPTNINLTMPLVESNIEPMIFDTVKILSAAYTLTNDVPRFVIKADGPISNVMPLVLDRKIVLDVGFTQNMLTQQTYKDNPVITAIRTSQFMTAPMTTRIVFDLKENSEKCKVTLSEDRTSLVVEFEPKFIHTVELGQNQIGDFIRVEGMAPTQIQTFRLSNPDRIVFDLVGTKSALGWKEIQAQGQFVTGLRTDQYSATTTRIVAITDGFSNFKISQNGAQTWIQFSAPTISNISYAINAKNPVIRFMDSALNMDETRIRYVDDYQNMTYTVILPGDYSQQFGSGELLINDNAISQIEFKKDNAGQTNIVIKQREYYEYRLEKTSEGYRLKGYKPRELYRHIVLVDPGHGGSDPGAVSGKFQEKTLNLSMTMHLKEILDASNQYKVYYTRTTDIQRSLQYRTDLAKTLGVDMFISIHNNAMSSAVYKGMETLYMPGGNASTMSSYAVAKIFHDTLISATGMADRGLKSREGLYVLRNSSMPAIILEIGFMTNPEDLAKLSEPAFQKIVAQAIFDATGKVFNRFPTGR